MTTFYKIKVGIEEYPINEVDIPRIVQAMKTNDMVKLDCGIFRGQAILAVARDIEKESQENLRLLSVKNSEDIKKEADQIAIKKQISECKICNEYKGYVYEVRDGQRVLRPCVCTKLVDQK